MSTEQQTIAALAAMVARGEQDPINIPVRTKIWCELKSTMAEPNIYPIPRSMGDIAAQFWIQIDNPPDLLPRTAFEQACLLEHCSLRIGRLTYHQFTGIDLYLHGRFIWKKPNLMALSIPGLPIVALENPPHHLPLQLHVYTRPFVPITAEYVFPTLLLHSPLPRSLNFLLAQFSAEPTALLRKTVLTQAVILDSKERDAVAMGETRLVTSNFQSRWFEKKSDEKLVVDLPFINCCYQIGVLFQHPSTRELWTGPAPFSDMRLFINGYFYGLGSPNAWQNLNESATRNPGTYHLIFQDPPVDGGPEAPINSMLNLDRFDSVRLEITWQHGIPDGLQIHVSAMTRNLLRFRDRQLRLSWML